MSRLLFDTACTETSSGLEIVNSNAFRLNFFCLFRICLVYVCSCKQVQKLCSVNAGTFYWHYFTQG